MIFVKMKMKLIQAVKLISRAIKKRIKIKNKRTTGIRMKAKIPNRVSIMLVGSKSRSFEESYLQYNSWCKGNKKKEGTDLSVKKAIEREKKSVE